MWLYNYRLLYAFVNLIWFTQSNQNFNLSLTANNFIPRKGNNTIFFICENNRIVLKWVINEKVK